MNTSLMGAAFGAILVLSGPAFAQTQPVPDAPFEMPKIVPDETDAQRYERLLTQGGGAINGRYGPEWSGSVTAAASISTGNSESADLGVFGRMGTTRGLYTHELDLGYNYARAAGNVTTNKLYGGYQLNRSFADGLLGLNDKFYGFGTLRGVYDKEGAYRHDYFVGAGLGYNIVATPQTQWSVEAGPGVRFYDVPTLGNTGALAIRGASRFRYVVSPTVSFDNDTYLIWSNDDTNLINDSAFKFGLTENLSARLGVRINHHTNPPATYKSTDTTTYAGVTYGF